MICTLDIAGEIFCRAEFTLNILSLAIASLYNIVLIQQEKNVSRYLNKCIHRQRTAERLRRLSGGSGSNVRRVKELELILNSSNCTQGEMELYSIG